MTGTDIVADRSMSNEQGTIDQLVCLKSLDRNNGGIYVNVVCTGQELGLVVAWVVQPYRHAAEVSKEQLLHADIDAIRV